MVPAVGVLGSVVLLGERPQWSDWLGLALVVAAAGSIMLPARSRPAETDVG
jgi:drug/metabolite transporter (DMT)-like permease